MTERGPDAETHTISGLLTQLADDAQRLVKAEVGLARAAALHRLSLSKVAIGLLATAALIALAALVSLMVMLAIALSSRLGPVGAGLLVAFLALVLAGALAAIAARQLAAIVGEDKP